MGPFSGDMDFARPPPGPPQATPRTRLLLAAAALNPPCGASKLTWAFQPHQWPGLVVGPVFFRCEGEDAAVHMHRQGYRRTVMQPAPGEVGKGRGGA